jgi:hypothetical protein
VRGEGILTRVRSNTIRIFRRIPQSAGHTNERNYVGVVVYSALQKRYFLPDFPVIAEKVFWKGGGNYY